MAARITEFREALDKNIEERRRPVADRQIWKFMLKKILGPEN
jgi:hypothetical protein